MNKYIKLKSGLDIEKNMDFHTIICYFKKNGHLSKFCKISIENFI